ncbi:hypothetical protein ATANTOWER_010782 [Ataeniobius toweri]|uniref:Uncharacterized protein n=1 Tax=Ataeniobius toweri TaxID=208326 RepID=A0ABU7A6J9_9TELE|nr:hypothetical protein [Ataeniobius toweri]
MLLPPEDAVCLFIKHSPVNLLCGSLSDCHSGNPSRSGRGCGCLHRLEPDSMALQLLESKGSTVSSCPSLCSVSLHSSYQSLKLEPLLPPSCLPQTRVCYFCFLLKHLQKHPAYTGKEFKGFTPSPLDPNQI